MVTDHKLSSLLTDTQQQLTTAFKKVSTQNELETARVQFLGREGVLAQLMGILQTLSLEEKRLFGPQLNALKQQAQLLYNNKKESLLAKEQDLLDAQSSHFDVTAYQPGRNKGSLHPYTHVAQKIEDIFISMGYEIADGPEIETDFYNFEALNIPQDHPARDSQDTFWINNQQLMRTHTSSVQIHAMQNRKGPLALVSIGRAYRNEATDASHDFMFMQLEGLYIAKNVSLSHLFGTMKLFLQKLFNKQDLSLRMRPNYFPFVEPGVEIDMTCPFCSSGCSVCKQTTWIEICGAGLVHPYVLRACGINPEQYSGFAFGFGFTRLAMLVYGIPDVRIMHGSFYGNKIEFLEQFK